MPVRQHIRTKKTKGFFITATDTGVGKTVITAALIHALRHHGLNACGMKPIESGCSRRGGSLVPEDGNFIKTLTGMNEDASLVSPVCFASPLAPMPAAELEQKSIDFQKIEHSFALLLERYDAVVAEGIGGILVPIQADYFVIDMAKDLGMPILIVTRPGLGMINHTLLTIDHITGEKLNIAGIIINYSRPAEHTPAEETNPSILKKLSRIPIVGTFPYLKNFKKGTLREAALKSLDMNAIMKALQGI